MSQCEVEVKRSHGIGHRVARIVMEGKGLCAVLQKICAGAELGKMLRCNFNPRRRAILNHVAASHGEHRECRDAADSQDRLEKQFEDIGMKQFHGNDPLG